MDEIEFRINGISGKLPLKEAKMHSVPKGKYKSVTLGLSQGGGMIVPFSNIKLYNSDRFIDAKKTFEDATKLGKAIADAWNRKSCKWKYDTEHDMWETECGDAWTFLEGNLTDNKCRFCPHCGRKIVELIKNRNKRP